MPCRNLNGLRLSMRARAPQAARGRERGRVLMAHASECNSIWKCYCACRRHQGCHCMKRKLRYVADFWAALGQAAACQYLVMWGVGRKEQWRVEKLRADPIR